VRQRPTERESEGCDGASEEGRGVELEGDALPAEAVADPMSWLRNHPEGHEGAPTGGAKG